MFARWRASTWPRTSRRFARSAIVLGLGSLPPAHDPTAAREELVRNAGLLRELLGARESLRGIAVGRRYDEVAGDEGAPDDETAPAANAFEVSFDPEREPDLPPEPDDAMLPWEVVRSLYDLATTGLLAVAGTSPVLYGALESDRVAELVPSAAPEDIAFTAGEVLLELETNILETVENLEGDLDWRELSPIISELAGGKVVDGGSGFDWSAPFHASLVRDEVGDHAKIRALQEIGWLIPAVALMFSPLGWPALVAGGLLSAAEVANRYQRWDELRAAAGAGATPETELVASKQAQAAEAELILATVSGFLGVAADVGALALRGSRAAKAGSAVDELDASAAGGAGVAPTSPRQRAEAFQSRYPKVDDDADSMAALEGVFGRAGRTGPDDYLPIHTRAHSQELKTIIRYATDPDVLRVELIPSSSGGRSPDLILEIQDADGMIRRTRVEITTLIGTTAGRKARGGAGAKQPVVDDIVRAVRNKAKDDPTGRRSQLAVPMDDAPAGGTLAIHLPYAGADADLDIASAMDELTSFLTTTPHVEAIEFFLPGATRVRYVRGTSGDYVAQ